MHIAQEWEGKARRFGERLVTEGAVPADRQKDGAPIVERAGGLSQAVELGGSDPAPVVAVERDDHVTPLELVEGHGPPEGGRQ